jgi:DNA-binding response OmpR family regulator
MVGRSLALAHVRQPRRTVLVVDDDEDIRGVVAEIMDAEGFHVLQAANGAEALSTARRTPPDLIILDLMMPVMDGWEFSRRQRLDRRIARVPVLAVSAGIESLEAHPIDVDRFLRKPMQLDRLLATVRDLLGAAAGPRCTRASPPCADVCAPS